MNLVIVGSVALDDIRTPAGEVKDALGGSAVYASISASYYAQPGIVGVVGGDFPEAHLRLLSLQGVVLDGVEKAAGETFHWSGFYEKDMAQAHTLDTRLNVFASFSPKIPDRFLTAPFLFLGNIDPVLQLRVLETMRKPKFSLLDTMNYWIETKRADLLKVLSRVTMVVVNDQEARQLSGLSNLFQAARWIQSQGPRGVAIKKGEHGALLFWDKKMSVLPAVPLDKVVDPTGAGDTFAGGLIGALTQSKQINIGALQAACLAGTINASYTVEDFSVRRLVKLKAGDILRRHRMIRDLARIGTFTLKVRKPSAGRVPAKGGKLVRQLKPRPPIRRGAPQKD